MPFRHHYSLALSPFSLLIILSLQVFVKDTIVMRWFKLLSWLSPLLFILPYGVARYFSTVDNMQ